ncbi:MAG: helix-turn-helix domain-containing protein [Oscillospiraceae bacterium]|nr:helix-turn-helix domain-containing protein [Oscillospiraceae bacterium]
MRVNLIHLRREAGFSQYSFARAVGISRSHYAQIETGGKNPSLNVGIKMKSVLAYHDDDIFFNQDSPKTRQLGRPRKKLDNSL